MNRRYLMLIFSVQLWSVASPTNMPGRNSFETFQIISQRNIFNPNRSMRGSRNESAESTPKTAKTESFSLVGTLLYEEGQFAFFDSSVTAYKKAMKRGDSIAGYKIAEITANSVKLEMKDKTIELAIGQQLRRQDEGEWTVSGKAAVESADSGKSSVAASAASDDEDEAVKRLMKKRAEELNK